MPRQQLLAKKMIKRRRNRRQRRVNRKGTMMAKKMKHLKRCPEPNRIEKSLLKSRKLKYKRRRKKS